MNTSVAWTNEVSKILRDNEGQTLSIGETTKLVALLGNIRELVSYFLQMPSDLAHIAARSYVHYNGFDKFVLLSSHQPNFKLRLHVWWPENREYPSENIHNHRWDFTTLLVAGSYQFEEFQTDPDGDSMYEYKYLPPDGRDHYGMEFIGKTRLNCLSSGCMQTGSYYTLTTKALHRVATVRRHPTISVLVQRQMQEQLDVRVFSENEIKNHESIESSPLTVTELTHKLRQVLEII